MATNVRSFRDIVQRQITKETGQTVSADEIAKIYRALIVKVSGSVRVPGKPGYVWHQPHGTGDPTPVYNNSVTELEKTAVVCGWRVGFTEPEILYRDRDMSYLSPEDSTVWSPGYSQHGQDHEPGGFDPMTLYTKAVASLMVKPLGDFRISISPGRFELDTKEYANSGLNDYDLEAFHTALTTSAKRGVGVSIDRDNAFSFTVGDEVARVEPLPEIPWPDLEFKVATIILYQSQNWIDWEDVKDKKVWHGGQGLTDLDIQYFT